MPRFLSCHQKGLQRSQGACFWTRACLFLAGMGSFPCKPLPDPWVPGCTSPSKYDFLVCRKVLSWDKPSASSPTLARYLDGRGDPGLVHSRRSGGGEGGTSHPQYFSQAWGGGSLLPHLSCSVPLSRRCWVWLGKGKSVPTPFVTAGNQDTLVHLPPDVTSSSDLLLPFLSFRVPLGAEF